MRHAIISHAPAYMSVVEAVTFGLLRTHIERDIQYLGDPRP
jgi:hypothetical protein